MAKLMKFKTNIELNGNLIEVVVKGRYYAPSSSNYEAHGYATAYHPAEFELLDVLIPSASVIDGVESVLDIISDEEAERIVDEFLLIDEE